MYKGYRIKIDGVIFPNEYILHESWVCTYKERRTIEEFNDAYGERHVNVSPHQRTSISFKLEERNVERNLLLMPYFANKDSVNIEYYVDETGEYVDGVFRLQDFKLETKYVDESTIWYKETLIEYEEY